MNQHAPAVLNERQPKGCRKMRLASAGRAEHQQIGALLEPTVPGRQRHHLGLADHRHRGEVEAVEGLAGRKAGLVEMALDAPAGALGHLVLGQRRQEAGRRPALLVGAGGEVRPDRLDGRQTQIVERQGQATGIDGIRAAHATSP